jgi:hypothetical protein
MAAQIQTNGTGIYNSNSFNNFSRISIRRLKMKRNIFFMGMPALAMVFGLVFVGCDNGSTDDDPVFTAKTNNATANDVATLGIAGDKAESSATGVATVAITDGKIAITSVAKGAADITVSVAISAVADSLGNAIPAIPVATIPVTVSETGDIAIGTIVKVEGVADVIAGHSVDAAETTLGLTLASACKVGTTTYFKIAGTVDMSDSGGKTGTGNATDIHDSYPASSGGYSAHPTHYGVINIGGLTTASTNYLRVSYSEAIEEYYGWAPVADSKSQSSWAGTAMLILISKDTTVKVSKTTISYDSGASITSTYYFDYSGVEWAD